MPAAVAATPDSPQANAITRSTEMPTDQDAIWSSEMARIDTPDARVEEQDRGRDQRQRDQPAEQVGAVDQHLAQEDRLAAGCRGPGGAPRPAKARQQPAQQDLQAERQHQDHDDRLADHAAQHHALDPACRARTSGPWPAESPPRSACPRVCGEDQAGVGADHRERALRQVGVARGLVDQHDAQRHQRVHQADQRAVDRRARQAGR